MLAVFHPCDFNFHDVDARIVGTVVDGGTSISGFSDRIETDGGGYWRVDLTNGSTRDRQTGLAWRAVTAAMDGGAQAVIVLLCAERFFAPVGPVALVPHSDGSTYADGTPYRSSGADYTADGDVAQRATSMQIAGASEKPLIGGEIFAIQHDTWGWRAYRVIGIDGNTITFRPPLREAVDDGTSIEFDSPRCQMRLLQSTSNPTNIGRFTACTASFVEDMRRPS